MQNQYEAGTIDNGWIIFAHIERAGAFKTGSSDGGYNIEHFRDFNNAGPDVCYGFEGAPGHQVNDYRGLGNGYLRGVIAHPAISAGPTAASAIIPPRSAVSGTPCWVRAGAGSTYASSDYHKHWTNCTIRRPGDDFYPGEYQKTYVYSQDKNRDRKYSLNEIADGLRSGNSYFVHGDLINHLEFTAQSRFQEASMGEELKSKIFAGSKNL